jgi:predicted DNA-binding protein (MmcQ/YjbR family)
LNIEEFREYCIAKKAVTEAFPFDATTLVFKVCGKMFALSSLNGWENGTQAVNLKCEPEKAIELRADYSSIEPGFHMNKKHWNTLKLFKGELKDDFIKDLIDHSYDLVVKSLTKKQKVELLDTKVK